MNTANEPTSEQSDISIERATPDDVDIVLDILEEAARWLLARSIEQWVPEQFKREPLLARIAAGEVYLAWRNGTALGTLTLQWADPRIWGEQAADASYVHGLAIRRVAGGQGVGLALLRWAEGIAAGAGKMYLRLDCMAENAALRAYYERAGFTHLRDVFGKTWGASLYEKRVQP
jgi:GNAT superfamily N-acetyltransferase